MDLFLLYAFKGPTRRLVICGLLSSESDAQKWVSKNSSDAEIPRYHKVSPDKLFYSVRVELEDGPEFSFLAQAPHDASPPIIREKINADTPQAIEEFIQKNDKVGKWHAGAWKIIEISKGY